MHRRHPIDRDDVRGDAGVHLVLLRGGRDFVERTHHDALEAPVDGVLAPEVTAAVLYPLEVAHGPAAGVRENVRNDENALLLENLVGRRRRRAIRPFADDLRLDLRGVLTGDDVLGGGGHEHVTLHREQCLLADRLTLGITRELTMLLDPLEHVRDVQPPRVVYRTRFVRHGDDDRTDRKSTRLNSSHGYISYAVFCLKKKKENHK